MFLKNYTSNVPVSQTIYKIEQVLIRCGVTGITKEYGTNSEITAIRFHIPIKNKEVTIRLPADAEKAQDALWRDYAGEDITPDGTTIKWGCKKKLRRTSFREQGQRTAWKIIQDWIEVQMSMIQMQQADTVEVFMPYIWDGQSTVYQRIKEGGYRALLPETTG